MHIKEHQFGYEKLMLVSCHIFSQCMQVDEMMEHEEESKGCPGAFPE